VTVLQVRDFLFPIGTSRGSTKQVRATLAFRLQAKLAVRAEAHQFQTGGIRLWVDENQVGLEMTIAKIALLA
jgi:hypothetical protein